MKNEYIEKILKCFPLPFDKEDYDRILKLVLVKEVSARTILLFEGDIATKLFFVLDGCLRTYCIKENGVEITSQFFVEGQMVTSFESAMTGTPSRRYIDAVEDSILGIISMKNLENVMKEHSLARDHFNKIVVSRLIYYINQNSSFILDNPENRYKRLLQENPELVSRLPLQYIASYLGITPVSLSRIRARLKKIQKINNC
jgi:CRP-like cAMP-binding protein